MSRCKSICVVGAFSLASFSTSNAALAAAFDCVLYPSATLKLGSPAASVLDKVVVNRGDLVKKGDVVATLESLVEAADVSLQQEKANDTTDIKVGAVKTDVTKREYERQAELNKTQATPMQKFDQASADYQLAVQESARAQFNHRIAALELNRAKAALEQRVIRSPIDGVVTQRSLGPGEYVSQDASIVTVATIDPLYVETFLPTRYYQKIKLNDLAVVRPNDPVGGAYQARVSVVDTVFDAASGTFGVRLLLPNANHAVPGGFRCRVEFAAPEIPDAPAVSLKEPELERGGDAVAH